MSKYTNSWPILLPLWVWPQFVAYTHTHIQKQGRLFGKSFDLTEYYNNPVEEGDVVSPFSCKETEAQGGGIIGSKSHR